MKTVTYHVPAFDLSEAREIAYAVDAGSMGHIEHYLSADAAERVCSHLNRLSVKQRQVFAIVLEQRVTDDGRIRVARTVDGVGEIAAALMLAIVGPVLVGLATLI